MKLLANIGLLIAAFGWGAQIPVLNELLARWDPYFLAAARYALAVPPLLAILAVVEPSGAILRPLRDGRIWLLGLALGAFVPLYTLGVAHADPNTAAIVGSTGPAVAAVVGWACFGLPFDRSMVPAIVLAMAGGVLATYDPGAAGGAFDLRGGELLILLASACWAWYSLAAQRWLAQWSQLRISCVTMVPGTVVSVVVYLAAALVGSADLPPAAPTGVLDIGLLPARANKVFGTTSGSRITAFVTDVVVASLFLNFVPAFTIPSRRWRAAADDDAAARRRPRARRRSAIAAAARPGGGAPPPTRQRTDCSDVRPLHCA
jgi:drug/metabolite transporter (DMT)-like permease